MRLVEVQGEIRFYEPDGININDNCGSTHLGQLKERVRSGQFDLGVAFDGDADRCLIVDDKRRGAGRRPHYGVCAAHMKKASCAAAFVATIFCPTWVCTPTPIRTA